MTLRTTRASTRWADVVVENVALGQRFNPSREVFRVEAPEPCTWKVLFAARAGAALNFPVFIQALFKIGVGSFMAPAQFDIAFNTNYVLEIPAQILSLSFVTDVANAVDQWQFGGTATPLIPWKGLQVIPVTG